MYKRSNVYKNLSKGKRDDEMEEEWSERRERGEKPGKKTKSEARKFAGVRGVKKIAELFSQPSDISEFI